jgi:hypothetical protein
MVSKFARKTLKRWKSFVFSKELEGIPHWEWYGRIRFAAERIQELQLAGARVLDVGGATGDNLLRRAGISQVTTLDTAPGAPKFHSRPEASRSSPASTPWSTSLAIFG